MNRNEILREMDRCERIMDIWFRILIGALAVNVVATIVMIVGVLTK